MENLAENLLPFSYFRLRNDLVGYCRRHYPDQWDEPMVGGTLVFAPYSNGKKVGPNGKLYSRYISSGNDEHLDRLDEENYPENPEIRQYVWRGCRQDPETLEPVLVFPSADIAEIYDPRARLQGILNCPSDDSYPIVAPVVETITQNSSIPPDDIGVYGSVLCQFRTANGQFPYGDVDIVIYGTKHFQDLRSLVATIGCDTEEFPEWSKNHRGKIGNSRRKKSSLIINTSSRTIQVDIKMVRSDQELNSFPSGPFQIPSTTTRGIVVDDSESLCTPMCVKVVTSCGVITVGSYIYDFLAPASIGDRVEIFGRKSRSGEDMILSDPERHFIRIA